MAAVSTQVRCVDAAREAAARLVAQRVMKVARSVRRVIIGPPGATVEVRRGAISWSSASARTPLPPGDPTQRDSVRGLEPANHDGVEQDRGSVTVLAAFMVAALVSTSVGGVHITRLPCSPSIALPVGGSSVLAAVAAPGALKRV